MTPKDQSGGEKKPVDQSIEEIAQAQARTRSLGDTDYEVGIPKWGSARFQGQLVLDVLEADESFAFDGKSITEVVLGRKDPDSNETPEVDLTASDAAEKGVSRRHATIINRDGSLYVMDNGSSNGTFLNGQRLVANQARVLRDGDDVRLGHLVVRVTFRVS